MRIILDTNVIISAALSKYSVPAQVLDYTLGNLTLLFSQETYQELAEKLLHPKFDRYVTSEIRQLFLEKLIRFSERVTVSTQIEICRDIKDNKFLELAIDGTADFIVTGDKDLLILHLFQAIQILTPHDFLTVCKK